MGSKSLFLLFILLHSLFIFSSSTIRTLTPPLPSSLPPSASSTATPQKWAPLCGHDVSRVLAKGLEGKGLDPALVDQVSE